MKERVAKKMGRPRTPENPRKAVVDRLLSWAELMRTKAKITDEADEALDWEKKLRKRAAEIDSGKLVVAA